MKPLTLKGLHATYTANKDAQVEELHARLVSSFGPEVDDVLGQVFTMVVRDLAAGRDPEGTIGGALSLLLLTIATGGEA